MRSIQFLFLLIFSLPVFAFDHEHTDFSKLLNSGVIEKGSQTAVDYDYFKRNVNALTQYLTKLESVSQQDFKNWNENQQLAFLINAYNAFTIKLIVDNYPGIDSIRDLGGFFSSPWDKEFFTLFGNKTNLDHIEHGMLREEYNEPRIHFAINCASRSCPALQNTAFIATSLNEQLENAAFQFIRDPAHNRFNENKKRLEVSSIFKWFKEDFTKSGSLKEYIVPYFTDDSNLQAALQEKNIKIIFLDYDWSLNKI